MTDIQPAAKSKKLSFHKMIPNLITLSALAAGMTSMKFAIAGKWEHAVVAIVAAGFLDGIDGAAARLLKASSKLGAELDSFSDFVSFGVAPAIVTYLWSTHNAGRYGWFIALVYAISIALRLARFNVAKEEEEDQKHNPLYKYFVGVPSPLAAALCLLPMILSFLLTDNETPASLLQSPPLVGAWSLIVGFLAVSHIPTFSSKQIRFSPKYKVLVLCFSGLLIAGLINEPWLTLTLIGVAYITSLPLGFLHYQKKKKALEAGVSDPDDADHDDAE